MLGNVELFYRANSTSWRDTNGAQERTRTSTPLRAPAPEAGASTNSATWARRSDFRQGAALKRSERCLSMFQPRLRLLRPLHTQEGLPADTPDARKSLQASQT